jgi:organic radical activating enzyme
VKLTGLHLLLTYQCTLECNHCFVWGSPWQSGTLTLADIRRILDQAEQVGTVTSIYFEGGEPFLYYPILLEGVRQAARRGFQVGIVSNTYWATSVEDALAWLEPMAGLVADLSISSDLYHWDEAISRQTTNARLAAEKLSIPVGVISVAQPEATSAEASAGQLPLGESAVMYRGRAAEALVGQAGRRAWDQFVECPHEDLREPGRVHVDALGNLHICQGISAGNILTTALGEICQAYDADRHPITGPLLAGGPVELVRRYELPHAESYADACHLCYEARRALRDRFPDILMPDQMYGVPTAEPLRRVQGNT